MTNGYVDIQVGAAKFSLFFGRQSVEEFARRTERYMSDNSFKICTDMVYSGMANFSTKHDLPVLGYEEVYDLMETFADQDDYSEQFEKVTRTFWESKYGSDYSEKLAALKKKVEEELAAETMELEKKTKTKTKSRSKNTGTT